MQAALTDREAGFDGAFDGGTWRMTETGRTKNKELVRSLFEDELSTHDEQIADELIHPNFVDHTNPPGMQHGVDGHRAIVALFRQSFPDMRWEIHDLVAEGDRVAARVTMRGAHTGDFFGIPATNRAVEAGGVHILRIADGKIVEHWGCNDDLSLMRQLGVVPS
jgi:steroid delta-isomerase-like uncharacterized protein